MVHDKSGQDTINRPSIVFTVDHGYFPHPPVKGALPGGEEEKKIAIFFSSSPPSRLLCGVGNPVLYFAHFTASGQIDQDIAGLQDGRNLDAKIAQVEARAREAIAHRAHVTVPAAGE